MFRPFFLAALVMVPLAPIAAPPPLANDIPHEPMIVYEVAGSTFIGPFDRELIVYQDGTARLSSATSGPEGKSHYIGVPSQEAIDLFSSLAQDGAFQLEDQPGTFNDIPLSTLTVMRPLTNARAHTYSWWSGDGAYQSIEQKLNAFIADNFPNF